MTLTCVCSVCAFVMNKCIQSLVSFKNQLNLLFYLQFVQFIFINFIGCQLTTSDDRRPIERDIGANIYSVNCTNNSSSNSRSRTLIFFSIERKSVIQVVCATPNACYKWHLFIDGLVIFLTTLLTGLSHSLAASEHFDARKKWEYWINPRATCKRSQYSAHATRYEYEKLDFGFVFRQIEAFRSFRIKN